MKIRPVILCGGAGTRLWTQSKNNLAKQFIDFGGWSLLEKTLGRVKGPAFDYPIISTNSKYLRFVLIIGVSNVEDLTLSRVFPNKVQLPKSINCFA